MYKNKRRPNQKEAGNVALIPTYSDFKSRHGVWSLRSHFRNRNFSSDFLEMCIHITPGKTRLCTKTHFHTLNICIISLMRLLVMCPMTSFRRLRCRIRRTQQEKHYGWPWSFPGLTMKYHFCLGRDTIEKDVGNASLIPTFADFKSRYGVRSQTKRSKVIN